MVAKKRKAITDDSNDSSVKSNKSVHMFDPTNEADLAAFNYADMDNLKLDKDEDSKIAASNKTTGKIHKDDEEFFSANEI